MKPERIGGYEILGELGRGAMGVVYHARDTAIGRSVAVKVIRVEPGSSEVEGAHLRQRLIREAGAAGKMSHPGIVTVHQLGEDGANVFVVMEYVEGSSLEHLLSNNPMLDRAWTLDILAQIAAALDYAHGVNVVHRDVKPANILVRGDGRVKIADFGIAKIIAGATSGMTGTGFSVGSPAYMSPEQIQATQIDGRSDQFALGSIAFQMLTGRLPFKGDTAHAVMYQIVTADPFEQQPGDAPLSPEVRRVVSRALAKHPGDRFPGCAAFIQELTAAAGVTLPVAAQTSTAKIEAAPVKKKESKRWIVLPAIAGFLALALIGGGTYWYLHRTCCAAVPAASAGTPLIDAVTFGKLHVVKSLLAKGANVNEKDKEDATPLMIASEGTAYLPNNLPLVETLLAAKPDLEARDAQGRTALHRAAAGGKTDVVRLLLDSGALINTKANDGASPLFYAVEFGKVPALEVLIAHHAEVDLADATSTTPLMIASEGNAYLPNNTPLVEALLAAGASVDAVDDHGRSPLYRASAEPKPDAVRLLLDHNAKPNLRANDGSTPLIQAVTFSRPRVAQILANRGADVNQADASGTTPLMIAAETSVYIKDPAAFIRLLLEHGAKRELTDAQGRTALQRASESKNTAAEALLK